MSKKLMMVEVRGKSSRWSFHFYGDPAHIEDWRADGLEVNVIENTVPMWALDTWIPARVWCFMQDCLNFKNPFAK